ncbi:MAG: complex I subunit 5 family protein, partial [Geminicoccaceae bacterium]
MNVLHVVPSGLSLALEPGLLLALLIAVPLAAALLAMLLGRAGALVLAPSMLGIALILALLAKALIQAPLAPLEIGGWGAPLGIDLYLDGLALVMLVTTAVIVMAVALAGRAIAASSPQGLFWPLLLIGWAGLNALFLSADLFNLYVAIEVVSLAAIALTGLTRELTALRAALGYLFVSLLGSLFFLMGTALLYRFHGLLDLPLLAEAMTGDLSDSVALALITAGLLFKTALVPLHSWLPLAHASAAPPISALLSAIVVKATFYLLLRIWGSLGPGELPYALLAALGMIAVLWGSLQALRAEKLMAMIAYSTVAQLGYLFIALALLARAPDLLSAALL